MRTLAWLPLLLLGLALAPPAGAAPTKRGLQRPIHPKAAKRLKVAKAAKIAPNDGHCSEGELCPVHDVDTVYGFSKAFVDVHKQSSVMLALGDDDDFEGFCSGTLLGPNTIVTASHCFDESRREGTKDTEVRVVWNYHKQKDGSWAWPRYVGQLSSLRGEVPRLDLWSNGHKLVADVAAGAAACI
ncbi:MAG: trypsin-like serine peptidase [Nannocystaceae bacterium]|nr:S1 family peptidase [bacterium]